MEPFAIGELYTTLIEPNLQVGLPFLVVIWQKNQKQAPC